MRIEADELHSLWTSSPMYKRGLKRKSIDRLMCQVRRSMRQSIELHIQAPMVLFDEAVRFIMAFEDFQFSRELTTDNREFSMHISRLRSDVLAIREMIFIGQESAALALARVFFEDIDIAMALAIDPQFASAYGEALEESEFWSKQVAYGRIYQKVRKFLEAGGGDAEYVDGKLAHHKALKLFLSRHIHPTTSSTFNAVFPLSLERPGQMMNRPLGALGANLRPLCLTLADEVYLFSACCINMFIRPNPPLALAGYEPSAKMDEFIASAHVLQELVVKYLEGLWQSYHHEMEFWN